MASLAIALPILPGKTEQWKHYCQEMTGPRRSEYEASRKRVGITREVAFLEQTPQGDMVVVYIEAQDVQRAITGPGMSQEPFDVWFREHSILLLFAAAAIVGRVSILWVWIIAVGLFVVGWALQILGHQVFERRRPTLLDNPVQMLIRPMYIFAKLFIALGFRADLAAVLQKSSGRTPVGSPPYPIEGGADVDQTA
jgi:hypothetical protein